MPEETSTPNAEQATETTATAQSSAGTSNAETQAEPMIPKARFDQVNNRLKELEAESAKKAAEQQAADEKKLAESAEWQKLADKRKAAVDELTPKAEMADKLSALVLAQYEAEIKDWPEQVRRMAPGDEADVLAKLEWMGKAKPLAVELMEEKPPTGGNGRRPAPVSAAGVSKATSEQRAAWDRQARQRYK